METKYKTFLTESKLGLTTQEKIISLLVLMEHLDTLDLMSESIDEQLVTIAEGINDHLNKVGFKLHKSKGILDYIKSFVGGVGKVMFHIIKGDLDKAKELIKSISKEDILDFLYKLDLGTLHLFTGPIHMIDAWTGWDLAVNLKSHIEKGEGITDIIKKELQKVKEYISKLFPTDTEKQKELASNLDTVLASI